MDDSFPLKNKGFVHCLPRSIGEFTRIITNFLVIELSSRRGRDRDDLFPLKEQRIRGHFFYLFLYFFLED